MKFRVSEWLDTRDDNAKTYPTVYGIQCNIGKGWMHVAEKGKVLFFDTAKAASKKIADLQKRYCANADVTGLAPGKDERLPAQCPVDELVGREADVATYLKERGTWTSPTMIGREVWGYPHHSASASPVCKRLVAKGIAVRNDCGHYMLAPNTSRERL